MGSIGEMRGISTKDATKLRKAGVRTTESLLKQASTKKGRSQLSKATGLDADAIAEWVDCADLMRVKGVGAEYADLLRLCGVDNAGTLRRRNPQNLLKAMVAANDEHRTVRRLPTESMVVAWVVAAADL